MPVVDLIGLYSDDDLFQLKQTFENLNIHIDVATQQGIV